jgi:hypothetical protein
MVNRVFWLVSSRIMSTSTDRQEPAVAGITVSFGERFAASDQFDAIFKEGMGLVERTATYLDGQGRKEARALRGPSRCSTPPRACASPPAPRARLWLMIRALSRRARSPPKRQRSKRERVKLRAPGRPPTIKGFSRAAARAAQPDRDELRAQRPHLPARPRHRGGRRPGARRRQSRERAGEPPRGGLRQIPPPRRGPGLTRGVRPLAANVTFKLRRKRRGV